MFLASAGYTDGTAGPAYGPNSYVQGQPTTPLITTTAGGPDHFGIVDDFDFLAYVPFDSEGLWLVRISGGVDGSFGLLRPLAGEGGPMDYLLLINNDPEPIANPAIAVGDASLGALTTVPLASRGSEGAIAGLPGTPIAQLSRFYTWGTVIPSSLPADVAVEFNGESIATTILPGQVINLSGTVEACNPADLAELFGVLDLSDITAFVSAFTNSEPLADLAEPFGIFDLTDVVAFVNGFLAGCP